MSLPEEKLNVDDSGRYLLYDVGDEVELVARTGGMGHTYTGEKNAVF